MRMQTGIKLKKLNFKFNRTTDATAVALAEIVHTTIKWSNIPSIVTAIPLGRRPIKIFLLQTISGQTSRIKQRK